MQRMATVTGRQVSRLALIRGDILRLDLAGVLDECHERGGSGGAGPGSRHVKVVANLPYNITKDCLRKMLPLGDRVSHVLFMLQVGVEWSGDSQP
jgi:16S rRNA A1518/A1519 N6-dimethyltransferase RsmA/KsgA/DIM1 with predicted DNA glycosylase/AP lyase activity